MTSTPASPALVHPWQAAEAGEHGAAGRDARARRRAQDAELAARAQRGDEDAFRRLVERYQRKIYWVAYDILLDPEEARDVVQETFVRIHAALASFDPTRDFLNWIYRIARNLAIDSFRRRRRRAVPVDDLTGLSGEAPDTLTGASEDLRRRVTTVLADLPVEYRLALTLREYHGLSPRDIAKLTDTTYPTARWRLHRARALFRKAWEARYGAPEAEDHS